MEAPVFSPSSFNGPSPGPNHPQWPTPQQSFMPSPTVSNMSGNPSFSNGMPFMGNMMMPPAPMNMFQGLLHMTTQRKRPIGSIDDDQVLIRAFREGNGRNYRQILESLDMKNGYSSQQWKDYYLDHTHRLRRLINPPPPKPTPSVQPQPKAGESISQAPSKSVSQRPKPSTSKPTALPKGYAYSKIKTDGLPEPPSRSPSPPSLVIPGPRGNKFTDQDKDYFLRYVLWALKCDPSLTRQELCNNLEDKCPHHTAQSWNSYWRHHGELADKALERCRGEVSADTVSSSSDDDEEYVKKQPSASAHVRTTSNSIRATAISMPLSAPPRGRARDNGKVDQEKMGLGGGSITMEDKRELARYIASHTEVVWTNKRQRFVAFHEKWPQRSAAAWAETYRRFTEEIDTIVAIYRSQANGNSSIWNPEREGDIPAPYHRVKVEED